MNSLRFRSTVLHVALGLAFTSFASFSTAQNVAKGKNLYTAKLCESCHLADVKRNQDGILAGANDAQRILRECASEPQMVRFCGRGGSLEVSNAEALDIAAYIASASGAAQAPAITLSAKALTFNRAIGAGPSARQNLKITNSGNANLVLGAVALGGANVGDYALSAPAASARCQQGTTVAPKATCSVDISFDPAVVGARNATVVITPNAASGLSESTVTLNGTAVADAAPPPPAPPPPPPAPPPPAQEPAVKADLTTLSFGSQLLNAAGPPKVVTFSNTGNTPLTLADKALVFSGAQGAEFTADAFSTCANNGNLAPGATCTARVLFNPKARGDRAGVLTLKSNASDVAVNLIGAGIEAVEPIVSVSADTLDFGAQALQIASGSKMVVLNNTGMKDLVFDSANRFAISGADAQEFSMDANTSTCAADTKLLAQGSCTVVLKFTPGAAGKRVATLTINANAATDPIVALTGIGQAAGGGGTDSGGGSSGDAAEEGGCSMVNPERAAFDPMLWLLASGALTVLVRRRRKQTQASDT